MLYAGDMVNIETKWARAAVVDVNVVMMLRFFFVFFFWFDNLFRRFHEFNFKRMEK